MLNITANKGKGNIFKRKITVTHLDGGFGEVDIYSFYGEKVKRKLFKKLPLKYYPHTDFGYKYAKGFYFFEEVLKTKHTADSFCFFDENLEFLNYAVLLQQKFRTLTVVTSKNADTYRNEIYKQTGAYPKTALNPTVKAGLNIIKGEIFGINVRKITDVLGNELTDSLPPDTDFYGLYFAIKAENKIVI